MSLRLQLRFDDATTFNEEFRKNISKAGAFVACDDAPELRQVIEVELDLVYCAEQRVFEAEVVHVVDGSGVAVQFLKGADQLREDLDEFLIDEPASAPEPASDLEIDGIDEIDGTPPELETDETDSPVYSPDPPGDLDDSAMAEIAQLDDAGLGDLLDESSDGLDMVDAEPTPEPVWADESAPGWQHEVLGDRDPLASADSGPETVFAASSDPLEAVDDRRRSPRSTVRMPVRLDATNVSFEGHTRDLSETGVLISADGSELPIGKVIQLELQHPETGERIEVSGTVTRHIEGDGTVAAIGVNFELEEGQESFVHEFVGQAKRVEAMRSAAGISGRIEELGMPNLMQMLCSSSPAGTLTAQAGAEEAVFAFEDGAIRYVRLGALRGVKALSRMFGWEEGTFHFHAHVDELTDEDEAIPLTNAILEAARQLDEAARPGLQRFEPSTRFLVDLEAARAAELSQVEQAVLELAMPGLTLRRILDVIPETDAAVYEAVHSLAGQRVLTPQ
jgi:hypothetical protein